MKVTLSNYNRAIKDVDFSKLPKHAQEAHARFDDFVEFYDLDNTIKKMIDNHLNYMTKHLEPQDKPKSETKTASTKRKTAKASTTKTPKKQAKNWIQCLHQPPSPLPSFQK